MKTAVAIQHIDFEDLGYFEAPLRERGYDIRHVDARTADLAALAGADLLVVLGGPMGVYEADRFPFLDAGLRLIHDRLQFGRPLLGICLGAQLIARAMGARVHPGGTKEIGFAPVRLTPAGASSPLAAVTPGQAVLHWHGDTFDLPPGATLLASTDTYARQAFSAGPNVLALQFHLEAGAGIERWLTGHADELAAAGIAAEAIREGALHNAASLEGIARRTLLAWLSQLDGQ
ncbi:glutamine amidotransferase [Croceibacterium mercuriale]|uniref:Glutamine amidotransferase n=1 Tax=Croceibacterium mercuriale TaxID=1572751 RepID=A0A0B2BV19_9SPHN|nr:glutamine amidotransferase [Croceibacterium mercuriale]KHL25244.1 glutamine amidotransferase [Croceibacterium mercuriale]